MSQAEVPKIAAEDHTVTTKWTTWHDADFYLLKLKLDKIDNVGFWYYLLHPKQAWRDFQLYWRFRKLVKLNVKDDPRAKTFFKHKQSWAPPKMENADIEKMLTEAEERFKDKEKLKELRDLLDKKQKNLLTKKIRKSNIVGE